MRQIVVVALLVGVGGGCKHSSGGAPDAGADLAFAGAFAAHDKVDVLFMIDDSPGIPYVHEFIKRFPSFVKALDNAAMANHPASYHFGIVSSDLGAGPYTLNQGQCHPGGDGGKLQIGPAANATLPAGVSCSAFS